MSLPTVNPNSEKGLAPSGSASATTLTEEKPPFLISASEAVFQFESDADHGLKNEVVSERQRLDGPNALSGGGGVSVWSILATQIFNAMMLVLIICFAVSLGIQSWIEAGVIAAVVAINVTVGFVQEYKSAKTMDSLRSLASPTAQVIRNGKSIGIPAPEVVVGDIVEVKTGDTIPADLRIIEAANFETDEALLTGESLPVAKDPNALFGKKDGTPIDPRDIGVGDRINMAYTSSTVTKGRAKGVVTAIGMRTEIGAIAESLRGGDTRVRKVRKNEDGHAPWHRYVSAYALTTWDVIGQFLGTNVGTPLQRTLSWLAIGLFGIACVFALIAFAANNFTSNKEIILYAIATGLSMIPASLVVVLTITLAGGTRAMVKRNVIVRKLDSLEALGAVTDICSDKTGTLTQGKMVCKAAWVPSRGTFLIGDSNEAFNPTLGDLSFTSESPVESAKRENTRGNDSSPSKQPGKASAKELISTHGTPLETLLNVASMCNAAKVFQDEEGWAARGDPTECAIQVFAHRFEWGRERWTVGDGAVWTQIQEFPFDSDLKRMSVIYARNSDEKRSVFMKGAVERIFDACKTIELEYGPVPLDEAIKENVLANVDALAEQGLRVLAVAQKPWLYTGADNPSREEVEADMTLQGLVGLYDPPRNETQGAVRSCHHAGIQVHMLTGDHPSTARAIALQVGILPRNINALSKGSADAMVMTAAEFDRLSDDEVDALPLLPLVIARCAPHTKTRMVDALHRRKAFCAMTGDGVNDSPSLKRADVGIGMGTGSDVAKDASDLVLADDNFASILNAIEEGRRMFDNIQKFVLHLLAGNVMQAIVLLVGLAFKDAMNLSVFPLTPIEILYVICATASFPAMGLGAEKASPDIMKRKPHSLKTGIFTPEILIDMVVYGILGGATCLCVFVTIVWGFGDGNLGIDSNNSIGDGSELVFKARSATFATMTWNCLFLAWFVKDLRRSLFKLRDDSERPLTQWTRDLWANRFLFWSVALGFLTVFPIIYIPGLNRVVFGHTEISWEIGASFIALLAFIVLVELYKYGKRVYFRLRAARHPEEIEEMPGVFAAWKTIQPDQEV
ncbi:potassium/sodium efflux P-type ATPase, fungal-type [Microbotryum lychnidis-dioicae p1A1 Lamole]|uniref:P-type Na(+) transporter n=1 Tax=Microbotryum lychnidis-dioicae (strain p1A1 Lamole / MvSl-1064) TaxID=683840 RepID=U5GYK5_USTV1|nr:potassium/sodium efflux P-type ATPase, fungal-type [Microbotryum lychnidis-dioicae p1A1 Lamole]|eukprot:KDE09874.1 potassium/sodium efflux P-type ATPase, fungal-type [Microbotryum lychnidis-dioicae p1A1 Lamole]